MMEDYQVLTLENGLRVVHKQVSNTKIVHCGFVLDVGSRDERPEQQGLAHFWEHMAFKGTKRRKAYHILNRLDAVGGELNAYTTKEKIAFHASVLDQYFEKAVDLLTDITFDSIFPEKQIEKERGVILEEMAMYYDSPEDAIQDDFDDVVFHNHPLGKNILGTSETVKRFQRQDFNEFLAENLDTERVLFSVVGNIPFKQVKLMAEKYLANIPALKRDRNRLPFTGYQPDHQVVKRGTLQSQFAMGRTAYALEDEKRTTFFLLANLLGGPGMNSRLNMSLREKYGFVYGVDASFLSYTDTGLFAIFFGTEPSQVKRAERIIWKELKTLRDKPLGVLQLHRAKEQLRGQLAMAEENNLSLMLMMGKSLLDLGRIDSLNDIFARVDSISAAELQGVAQEMFNPDLFSTLRYEPTEH